MHVITAMLCIAPIMLSKDVCVSVCLSITRRYSVFFHVETAKRITKLFSHSGSHTILVFPHQTIGYDGNSPNYGVECRGYEKIVIFDQYLALSRK